MEDYGRLWKQEKQNGFVFISSFFPLKINRKVAIFPEMYNYESSKSRTTNKTNSVEWRATRTLGL